MYLFDAKINKKVVSLREKMDIPTILETDKERIEDNRILTTCCPLNEDKDDIRRKLKKKHGNISLTWIANLLVFSTTEETAQGQNTSTVAEG